jgi:lactaldehyde reductase
MFLPISMEFNREYTGERLREVARAMGVEGVDNMSQEEYRDAAIAAVKKLSEDVGIPTTLDKIKEEDLDTLATDALNDACYPGNPREATKEQVIEMFRMLMA